MIVLGYRKGQPFDLEVEDIGDGHLLEKKAARDFVWMAAAAKESGIVLVVNTAFRSMQHQQRLWRDHQAAMAIWDHGGRLGKKPSPVAQPGFSTHQEGRSVDINRAAGDDPKTVAHDSPVDLWLKARAGEYAFVNDVASEAWHWTHLAG